MTKMSAFSYLKELLDKNLIYKTGLSKNTRYFYQDKKEYFLEDNLLKKTNLILENEYEISMKTSEIMHILEQNFCYINPQN